MSALINVVHDAAISAGKRLCGPFAWRDRPDFTCFQDGSETAAIARGVAAELGPLANTQAESRSGSARAATSETLARQQTIHIPLSHPSRFGDLLDGVHARHTLLFQFPNRVLHGGLCDDRSLPLPISSVISPFTDGRAASWARTSSAVPRRNSSCILVSSRATTTGRAP